MNPTVLLLLLLFFTLTSAAQNHTVQNPKTDEKTNITSIEKEKKKLNDFVVGIKNAELVCDNGKTFLKIFLDQTLREIDRISEDFGSGNNNTTLSESFQKIGFHQLLDLTEGTAFGLSESSVELNVITFEAIGLSEPKSKRFVNGFSLFSRGYKLNDMKLLVNPTLTPVLILDSCQTMPEKTGKPDEPKKKEPMDLKTFAVKNFVEPQSKDSPEIKVSLAIDGTKTTKRYFQTEINAVPFELKRLGFHGAYSIFPVFLKLEKNGDPQNEVDKLEFGSRIRHYFVFNDDGRQISNREPDPSIFAGFKTDFDIKIETTTKFDETNIIGGIKFGPPLNVFQTRSQSLRITPFAGFDFGYKINSKIDQTKQRLIARPVVGMDFYWSPFRTEKQTPIVVEANYIRRMFIKPEIVYKRNDSGKAVVEGYTTNPKDYINFKMTLFSNQIFSPFIQYTYGRDLPKYLIEDSHYRGGVQINFDWGGKK